MRELRPLLALTALLVIAALPMRASEADSSDVVYFAPDLYISVDALPPPIPSMMADWEFEQHFQYEPVWDSLADCESGNRDRNGDVIEGSARWWYGNPDYEHPSWGLTLFHGGLQFLPQTWSWVSPMVLDNPPEFAWQASPYEQVQVAIRTQELQGWEAWPNCARKIGLLN